MTSRDEAILTADDVVRVYGRTRAVDGVRLEVRENHSVGIAGESGSGKSTLLRLLLALERPTSGAIRFEGQDLHAADHSLLQRYRQSVQAVFQDPGGSFNPRMRVWTSVAEPAWAARRLSRKDQRDLAVAALETVGSQRTTPISIHTSSPGGSASEQRSRGR
jgi:ABC-type dipeptide/oligopeptide/nickel transport system ATPase subunit